MPDQSDKNGFRSLNKYTMYAKWKHEKREKVLKEYYEIVGESRPLSAFSPKHADFFYRNAFLIMKLSNPPSFRAIRALIASQSTFEI